jgi:hypothetical protein
MPEVTINGETHDVNASAITYADGETPDGFVHQDDVDGIVQKRLSRQERSLKSELKEDDEFWHEAAQARGIELREDGKPKGSLKDEEVDELRRKASKVESLSSELESLRSEQSETRRTQLHNQVLTSIDGVQEGAKEDLLSAVERQMTYDDDYGWVKTDADGKIEYSGGEPVGVEGVASTIREEKPYFFKSTQMSSGPDSDPSGGGSGGGSLSLAQYERQRDRAIQQGDDAKLEELEDMVADGRITE